MIVNRTLRVEALLDRLRAKTPLKIEDEGLARLAKGAAPALGGDWGIR